MTMKSRSFYIHRQPTVQEAWDAYSAEHPERIVSAEEAAWPVPMSDEEIGRILQALRG